MKLLEELIQANLADYPEWAEYNDVVIDFIASHTQKRPDMCVEGCKSLIEGLSKLVYFNLSDGTQDLGNWKDLALEQKFKECRAALHLDGYEDEFLQRSGALVRSLGQVRNERGDVSHGQNYPKDSYSDIDFAIFITSWTEGLCYFLLSRYIAFRQIQKAKDSESLYSDEQFEEFDSYLDSLYSGIEYISYSKALREQDALQYELLMDEYYKKH